MQVWVTLSLSTVSLHLASIFTRTSATTSPDKIAGTLTQDLVACDRS
jgi:hypothetical protein